MITILREFYCACTKTVLVHFVHGIQNNVNEQVGKKKTCCILGNLHSVSTVTVKQLGFYSITLHGMYAITTFECLNDKVMTI